MAAGFKHCFDRNRAGDHVVEIGEKALPLTGVQLDSAEDVAELEAIDDHARVIGKSAGLDDVHAPGRQGSGHVGE